MKQLLCILFVVMISVSAFAQEYISDRQSSIGIEDIESKEYPPKDRIIKVDTIQNKVDIELVTGKHLLRNIKFIEHLYEVNDVYYQGYYETEKGEKLYIRDSEIAFDARKSYGRFYTYRLKDKKQMSEEEETQYLEKIKFESYLQSYGRHTADCFKKKVIQKGISSMVLDEIIGYAPLYREDFLKKDTVISVFLYKDIFIRTANLTVDQIIYLNK